MGSDIYSIGKTPDDNQVLQGRELLDKLLTEGLSVSGYLSCAYNTERFLVLQVNIYEATKLAMLEAIQELYQQPQHLLIDAMKLDLPISQTSIIKGDANSLSIAAASVVAKVTRDQMMAAYDQEYPGYDFGQNAGYGTSKHLEGLEKYGVTPIHRRSFEPIKSMTNFD